jgi:hypothetical protein
MGHEESCTELARILRESAERVEGTAATEREDAERRAAEFARRLRTDPTIVYDRTPATDS